MLSLNFDPFPVIYTEPLVIRKVAEEDAAEIYFLRSDKRLMKYLDKAPAKSVTEAIEFIRLIRGQEEAGDSVTWGITIVREAYFKEDYYFDGRFVDSAIYSLLTPLRSAI